MKLIAWLEEITGKMKWYDISLVKLSTFFATLFLITVWAGFRNFVLGFDWYVYLILFILAGILPLKRIFLD